MPSSVPARPTFTNAKIGRCARRLARFHLKYAFDDHRDHSAAQVDANFARTALALLRELIDEQPTQCVIICAAPRMLQKLRTCAPGILPQDSTLHELPDDLVRLSLDEVRAKLMAVSQIAPRLVRTN